MRVVLVVVAMCLGVIVVIPPASAQTVWPAGGQAAYVLGHGAVQAGPHQHVAPIASMAKVMTGYLVLGTAPLAPHAQGFRMEVSRRDVRDWRRRVSRDESTVPVQLGERITERQALAALLLPSANNIAIMLARKVAGSVTRFVRRMNHVARAHGMTHTTYTDPSGFDWHTKSTPRDQLALARLAMHRNTFRKLVGLRTYRIPVAGKIFNTDTLLGQDGFVGIKTGSMDASGGCFMFLTHRRVHGRRVDLYGVVMGQRGGDFVQAALQAARNLADRVS